MNLELFGISFISTNLLLILILTSSLITKIGIDGIDGPQKQHTKLTSRLGGVGIFISTTICSYYYYRDQYIEPQKLILVSTIAIAFFIGLCEDLTNKLLPKIRFILLLATSSILFYMAETIVHTDLFFIDFLLKHQMLVAILFTGFCYTGIVNSYNIIDGFHGLSSATGITSLTATMFIARDLNNHDIEILCALVIASTVAFLLWNYPKGKIFLGDAGAYLIGATLATCSIILSQSEDISPFVFICINFHAITETILTIYRRLLQKTKIDGPDRLHLHTLINRRYLKNKKSYLNNNARTSIPFVLSSIIISSISYLFKNNTFALICIYIFGFTIYLYIYINLVKFRFQSN